MCNMTNEQFEREKNYRTALSITKGLLNRGIITEKDYRRIDTMLTKKFRPLLGSI